MTEPRKSSGASRYIGATLLVEALLILISLASVEFDIRNVPFPLAVFGALALIFGALRLGSLGGGHAGVSAVNDMRGQAGPNPLANYASLQEYKLTKLRQERPGRDEDRAEHDETSELGRASSRKKNDGLVAACLALAGLVALGLSWLAGQMFVR